MISPNKPSEDAGGGRYTRLQLRIWDGNHDPAGEGIPPFYSSAFDIPGQRGLAGETLRGGGLPGDAGVHGGKSPGAGGSGGVGGGGLLRNHSGTHPRHPRRHHVGLQIILNFHPLIRVLSPRQRGVIKPGIRRPMSKAGPERPLLSRIHSFFPGDLDSFPENFQIIVDKTNCCILQ